ncbi:helix-turn-helix transcriptional regulator [Streptomyces sp. NPDC048295]|uniref:helix-turn-helix domain-containing protein n=1 Tax=Streptomyces sp. NPDC048295 TaxID=3154617 RepID=UPI00343E4D1D
MATSNKSLRMLVEWMREQRGQAGLTYRELGSRTGFHATTLQRVASGDSMPKLGTVLAYAQACDASPDMAKFLWKRARYEETRPQGGQRLSAPRLELVRDFADLGVALVELYRRAGSPSFRSMEERAGGFGALPRSTARRIVNRQALPHNMDQFLAFLNVCDLPEREQAAWVGAWSRAWRLEKQDAAEAADAVVLELVRPKGSEWFAGPPRHSERAGAIQRRLTRSRDGEMVTADVLPAISERTLSPRERLTVHVVPGRRPTVA